MILKSSTPDLLQQFQNIVTDLWRLHKRCIPSRFFL